jgi:hypothetical protein
MNLEQFSQENGYKSSSKYTLNNEKAKQIFLKVANEAQEKFIPDTVAAQYLVTTYKEFKHLSYNTVRKYFKDFRSGLIR